MKRIVDIDLKMCKLQLQIGGPRFYVGLVMALLSFVLCQIADGSLLAQVVLSGAFVIMSVLKIEFLPKFSVWIDALYGFCGTFVILFSTQLLLDESTFSIGALRIILGMAIVGVILVLLLMISADIRLSVVFTTILLMTFTAVNYFVYKFRGSELAPADFLSIGTAANVADQYRFSVNAPFIYACIIAAIYCFLGFCISKYKNIRSVKLYIVNGICLVGLVVFLILGIRDLSAYHFLQSGSVSNGYLLNFTLQVKENIIEKPDGYSLNKVVELESSYKLEDSTTTESTPDIIVIMNESFVDLSVLGNELKTNIDVTPYFNSLTENVIRGQMLSSVFGGGTPNSEYEFLSGNTMAYLPAGSIVYQQFIHDNSYTLNQYLKNKGYESIATHPCPAQNWIRDRIYPLFSFDKMYFESDYPHQELMRDFVSDQEMYEQIVSWYEKRNTENPFFLYGITMQNHGFYEYDGEDFTNEIELEGYSKKYPDVEQYLTVLHHSDKALKYLISYFEQVDNDVIIVFYGDHFPKLDSQFYEEVHGGTYDTLDEQMLQYTVPFMIWANYDIEEQYVEQTSINFLSNYLYEAAGLPLPAYNKFLKDVNDVIPAMNAFGYYSKAQGSFLPYDEAIGKEKDVLQKYQILQYNCLFDEENRSEVFFPALDILP